MRTMLLMSVAAAALIAGSGFASAQGPSQSREGSSPPPAAQPSAPAEKIAPMKGAETKAPDSGLKAGQTEPRTAPSTAAGAANLSTEDRTTIRSVIRQQNVQPATNVNFSISVGSRVSDNVHFYPLPAELVQIQPHWRGYQFFLVGNQIIVVNPQTHQIVAVLDA